MRQISEDCLNLYAGSNVLSPAVLAAHESALSTWPALGFPGEKLQPACDATEELEVIAAQQLRRAFGAQFAEPRYLSGTLANLGVYTALAHAGDTIAVLSPEDGSHVSHHAHGAAGVRGLRTVHLPYSTRTLDVDTEAITAFLTRTVPRLVVVGGSVLLFPNDLRSLRSAAERVGATLVYDASHVAGLIAAGEFPNPLDEGAQVMTFSTYKTLAAPAGGAVLTNDPAIAEKISTAIYPMLSSNYDAARLGPLAIATAEAVDQRPAWARMTIDLAREIGRLLHCAGLTVLGANRGYTDTHQVVVDVESFGGGTVVLERLERCGIAVGACRLSHQHPAREPMGMRLGTQAIVRHGATLEHAEAIADAVRLSLTGTTDESRRWGAEVRGTFGPNIWESTRADS